MGKCRMPLGQRQMANSLGDFLRRQPQLVPKHDPSNGNSSPRDSRATTADSGRSRNQTADINDGGGLIHSSNVAASLRAVKTGCRHGAKKPDTTDDTGTQVNIYLNGS